MNQPFKTLSAHTLRTLMLSEAKKFAQELEHGATFSGLEAIQARMKDIADVLAIKEQEESKLKTKK
jgi:hypothetical protein